MARGPSVAGIVLVAVALVLAFLVGRFTAPHGIGFRGHEPPPDSPEEIQKVEALVQKLTADNKWSDAKEQELLDAASKLSVKEQVRQLGKIAAKVNSGELKYVPPEPKAPAQKPGAPAQKK